MNAKVKQQFGIKYPFTTEKNENYFVDTNMTLKEKVRSILMHVIFTPKGQKIRDPQFGTDLIRHIFEPNDNTVWANIKTEINQVIQKHLNNVSINDISVLKSEEDFSEIFVKITYTVTNGINSQMDSISVKL